MLIFVEFFAWLLFVEMMAEKPWLGDFWYYPLLIWVLPKSCCCKKPYWNSCVPILITRFKFLFGFQERSLSCSPCLPWTRCKQSSSLFIKSSTCILQLFPKEAFWKLVSVETIKGNVYEISHSLARLSKILPTTIYSISGITAKLRQRKLKRNGTRLAFLHNPFKFLKVICNCGAKF